MSGRWVVRFWSHVDYDKILELDPSLTSYRVKRADLQKRQLDFELLLPGAAARRTEEPRGKGPKVRTSSRRKGR